jgi:hypothetical protein
MEPIRVIGSQDGFEQTTYSRSDTLVIDAGTDRGLQVGQEFYVRRLSKQSELPVAGDRPFALQTAGWVRIVAVQARTAAAAILHSCEGFSLGDYLEPFTIPSMPSMVGAEQPDFSRVARVLFGDQGKRTVAPGELILIDSGSMQGVVAGQRLTVFRNHFGPDGPITVVGDGIAVEPMPAMTMIKILSARGAVYLGDRVALHPVQR